MCKENNDKSHPPTKKVPMFDLNALPDETESDEEHVEKTEPETAVEKIRKRADSAEIAKITYDDVSKYFDVPVTEAAKCMKVGVTVFKRRCRELGIPRWPHRKIKSLDTLIHNLKEEVGRQEEVNDETTEGVKKMQMILEVEKETIERKPFMEIQRETKKFRQDVFKKRHKARVNNSRS